VIPVVCIAGLFFGQDGRSDYSPGSGFLTSVSLDYLFRVFKLYIDRSEVKQIILDASKKEYTNLLFL
jgi:hypothetical protein